jgi:hypothetical protein
MPILGPINHQNHELLIKASARLFGAEWQRALARTLGPFHPDRPREAIDDRLIRRWTSGERPIPNWAVAALIKIADNRATALKTVLAQSHAMIRETAENVIDDVDRWIDEACAADNSEIV